jgi:hypothetical protein
MNKQNRSSWLTFSAAVLLAIATGCQTNRNVSKFASELTAVRAGAAEGDPLERTPIIDIHSHFPLASETKTLLQALINHHQPTGKSP